jgi:HAD superfamily hydrolase (TIGR01509 family)
MTNLLFDAAVFDCDGTLVETRECWRSAYQDVIGEPVSEDLLQRLSGASTRIAAERLEREFARKVDAAAIEAGLMRAIDERQLRPIAGVERLLSLLYGRIPLGVATNGPGRFVDAVLGDRLRQFFDVVVPSEELVPPEDKPAPDVYLAACGRLGVSPQRAVAFEDAVLGARSAVAAGLTLVFVSAKDPLLPPEFEGTPRVRRIDDPAVFALLGIEQ